MKPVFAEYLLTITVFLIWILEICFFPPETLSYNEIILSLVFFLFFGLVAVFLKFLTLPAACIAVVIGTQVQAINDLSVLPLIVFFISGSILSRLPGTKILNAQYGAGRNSWQVLANGGVVFVLGVFGHVFGIRIELFYLVSVAAATADTWSSEIGVRLGKNPVDILGFKKLPRGLSGGVSLVGFLAGAAGGTCIALFSETEHEFLLVATGGFLGTLVDSILGSRFQASYVQQDNSLSEIPNQNLYKGLPWFNNNLVNILSNILAIGLTALFAIFK